MTRVTELASTREPWRILNQLPDHRVRGLDVGQAGVGFVQAATGERRPVGRAAGSPCAVGRRASATARRASPAGRRRPATRPATAGANSTTLSVFILRSPSSRSGWRGGVSWACRPASTPAIASGAAKNRHGVGHAAAVHAFFQFDGLALEHFRRAGDVVVAREQRVHLGLGVRQRAARSQFAGRVFLQDAMQVVDEKGQRRRTPAARLFPAPAFLGP